MISFFEKIEVFIKKLKKTHRKNSSLHLLTKNNKINNVPFFYKCDKYKII